MSIMKNFIQEEVEIHGNQNRRNRRFLKNYKKL